MDKAELYSAAHDLQKRDAGLLLSEYLRSMTWGPGERVLDLGCGPGFVTTQLLLPRLPLDLDLLVGADVSAAMVKHASDRYCHPKLKFVQLDLGTDIPVDSELRTPGFDKIFSFYCLHWILDQRRAVRNIFNLLRPGGEALIVFVAKCPIFNVYNSQYQKPEWRIYMEDVHRFISPYHQSEDPGEEFNELLREVGLDVIKCECRKNEYTYNSTDCLKESIKAVNPFLDRIPQNLHEEYLNDCLLEASKLKFVEENNNAGETLTAVRYELIIAYARKP
ncbi:juvenile hormone acid O-methyltransferase-like [Periplaneta americana]|uniref:juvenile hormone acid O-methyltransferase-like n=1 Tax=Periplaneta americana TaxID=6978 RepID=UPI0037E824FC